MRLSLTFLCLVGFVAASSPAWCGIITYVDAVANTNGSNGNTTIEIAGIPTLIDTTAGTGNTATGTGNDGKWVARTGQGTNGSQVWETDTVSASAETTNSLITTITGLTPGSYDLYAMFWAPTPPAPPLSSAARWDIEVRVGNSGSYTYYEKTNTPSTVVDASTLAFSNTSPTIVLVSGTNSLYVAKLGQFAIMGSSVDIYVNGPDIVPPPGPDLTNNQGQRTWYDGVGYEIVPEPAAVFLIGIGFSGLCLAWRRRRKTHSQSPGSAKS